MKTVDFEDVIEILEDVNEDVDYKEETKLFDDRFLTSLDVLAIISAIDDEFDVKIPAKDIVPENFNSAQALHALIEKLLNES